MILLLGASGYIGQAFVRELQRRQRPFQPLSRKDVDYARFDVLLRYLQQHKPEFLVNAAGYTGKPNVDACEIAKADTLVGNALLPQTIAQACAACAIPWGHVSSGCIFSGAKVTLNGQTRAEKDLTRPDLRFLVENRRRPFAVSREPTRRISLPRSALQFLQRQQGVGGGSHRRRRARLHLAAADSV